MLGEILHLGMRGSELREIPPLQHLVDFGVQVDPLDEVIRVEHRQRLDPGIDPAHFVEIFHPCLTSFPIR